ncbi:hypothetical protein BC940DRAFT_313283 [Gongronella butleri]|nr:hypothetical protein BC940DRAFT_313283 [Gongronella butleri]
MHFEDLPIELLCSIVAYLDTPAQYARLCTLCSSLYRMGRGYSLRFAFLSHVLEVDGTVHADPHFQPQYGNGEFDDDSENEAAAAAVAQRIDALHRQNRALVCRFLASSSVPLISPFVIDLVELVSNEHFCTFDYPDAAAKRYIFQLFRVTRHRQAKRSLTIPTLVNATTLAYATACNRHRLLHGAPRRVYYHVTIPAPVCQKVPKRKSSPTLQYPPKRLLTQATNRTNPHLPAELLGQGSKNDIDDRQDNGGQDNDLASDAISRPHNTSHGALPPQAQPRRYFCLLHDLNQVIAFDDDETLTCHRGTLFYEDEGIVTDGTWRHVLKIGRTIVPEHYPVVRSAPVGYYDYYKKTTFQRAWRPCLLATLYDCELRHDVRKGGLKRGDRFDAVFVFEHKEDDTICLEFCQRDRELNRWVPQGFLLFSEHHIAWHN